MSRGFNHGRCPGDLIMVGVLGFFYHDRCPGDFIMIGVLEI